MRKSAGANESSTKALRKLEAQGLSFTNEAFVTEFTAGGKLQNVALFIEAGIDVNTPVDGSPPIVMLASSLRGDIEIARILIDHGADVNAVNEHGVTAIRMAVFNNHKELVKLLIDNGAELNPESDSGDAAPEKLEITNIIERLELLEEKFCISISGLYASCYYQKHGTPPYHEVRINFDVASLNGGKLERSLKINASAYNSAGQLLDTSSTYINNEEFMGFGPMSILSHLDQEPARIRLFPAAY